MGGGRLGRFVDEEDGVGDKRCCVGERDLELVGLWDARVETGFLFFKKAAVEWSFFIRLSQAVDQWLRCAGIFRLSYVTPYVSTLQRFSKACFPGSPCLFRP